MHKIPKVSEVRKVDAFSSIEITSVGTIYFTQSDTYSFKIEGRMKKPGVCGSSRFPVPEIYRSLSEILRRMSGRRGSGSVCDEEIPCPRGGSADAAGSL